MKYADLKKKIDDKAAELSKLDAADATLKTALKAAQAAHVEALVAMEMEEAGADGQVRKAEGEVQKLARASEESTTRRQTLRAVIARMEAEAKTRRTSDLMSMREELGEKVLQYEPRYMEALNSFLAVVSAGERILNEIRELENELEGLVAPRRLFRVSLQLPLGSHIDLSEASKYASEVAAQNRYRVERIKLEPVEPVAVLVPA